MTLGEDIGDIFWESYQQLILCGESKIAETFYASTLSFDSEATAVRHNSHKRRSSCSAHLNQDQLELRGNFGESTRLTIIRISGVFRITWNSSPISKDLYTLIPVY